jgi:hypothetical protein
MPIVKVKKDSKQYWELKAKYESGQYTDVELAKKYKISAKQLIRYKEAGSWTKGSLKELYDAKKLVHTHDIIKEFKPKNEIDAIKVLEKEAYKEAKKNAEMKIQTETRELELKKQGQDILQGILKAVQQEMETGSRSDYIQEDIERDAQGRTITKKTKSQYGKYSIINKIPLVDLLKAVGAVPENTLIAIQNNNNQQNNQFNTQNNTAINQPQTTIKIEYNDVKNFDDMIDSEIDGCKVVDSMSD